MPRAGPFAGVALSFALLFYARASGLVGPHGRAESGTGLRPLLQVLGLSPLEVGSELSPGPPGAVPEG